MDRLRDLVGLTVVLTATAIAAYACERNGELPAAGVPPTGRFAFVKSEQGSERGSAAAASFCEKSYPARGAGALRWTAPDERPLPRENGSKIPIGRAAHTQGWVWINLWASWCIPCLKEMPLLTRWGDTLEKEGTPIRFELYSVDEDESALAAALERPLPGPVHWLKTAEDLGKLLALLGVDRSSAIPVHALVDRSGMVRCVRVGSVGEESYGTVRALLSDG